MQITQALVRIGLELKYNKLVQIDTSEDSYYLGTMEQLASLEKTYLRLSFIDNIADVTSEMTRVSSNRCCFPTSEKKQGWAWISDSDLCLKKNIVNIESIPNLLANFQRVHKEKVLRIMANDEIIYEYVKRDYDVILPNLLMGSIEALKTSRYDCVVNCTTNIKKPNHVKNYLQLYWLDSPDQIIVTDELISAIHTIHKWITIDKKIVLVHCEQGISRSGACVLAYLLEFHAEFSFPDADVREFYHMESTSFRNAYNFLVSKRGCAKPNVGFLKQLEQWNLTKY
jgi:protein-tyrosine phosphatase